MDTKYRRQFESRDEAMAYLEARGTLKYHGREGMKYEKYVYSLALRDGRVYALFVYDSGLVEVIDI